MRFPKGPFAVAAVTALATLLMLPAASLVYESSGGAACTRCHEIESNYDTWHASSHRSVACTSCHGDALTLDVGFHANNLQRLITHLRGDLPEQIRIRNTDVRVILERCRSCHRQEFADWQAGPHGVTYSTIFLDKNFNRKQLLMDDCLRCHGAQFEGGIRDLVTPIATSGPWALKDPRLADMPAIPCLSCHQIHREGNPLRKPQPGTAAARQKISRPSLALYDRRERDYFPVSIMSLPQMRDGERLVRMSPDPRQSLCYQCHAPRPGFQVGTGDDRTGIGVHEGLSCLACHAQHGQTTKASCASCHPRFSNCGLDVEKMDTTFLSTRSGHNIHFVKCADCHPRGVPQGRNQVAAAGTFAAGAGR
ncbi:MAG: hypothetical protein M1541_06690 [Acidobacteria bacterium]|nr:hypothetical protein [Acidobacteriota bacterium]